MDFGFYQSLNARPDYNARRQDQAMNLQLLQSEDARQRAMAEQRMNALSAVQQYFGSVDQATSQMFPQDIERVNKVRDELKAPVISKIKEYGNDPSMFLLMGGQGMLNNYITQMEQSPEFKKGMMNLSNYNNALKDLHNGKQSLRWTTYSLNDGTTKTAPFSENLQDYQRGLTSDIGYNGSYDLPKLNTFEYGKVMRNGEQVGTAEHVSNLIEAGELNPADVPQYLSEHGSMFLDPNDPNKTVFKWGERDPLDSALKAARIQSLTGVDKGFMNNYFLPKDMGGASGAFKPDYVDDQVTWNGEPKTIEFYNYPKEAIDQYAASAGIGVSKVKGVDVYTNNNLPVTFKSLDGQDITLPKYSINPGSISGVYVIRDPHDPNKTIQALKMKINIDAADAQNIKGADGQPLMGTLFSHAQGVPGAEKDSDWTFWNNLVHPMGGAGQGFNIDVYRPLNPNDVAENYWDQSTKQGMKGIDQTMQNNLSEDLFDEYLNQK